MSHTEDATSPSATITLELAEDGETVRVSVDFDPVPSDESENMITHAAALVGVKAIGQWLRGEAEDMEVPHVEDL